MTWWLAPRGVAWRWTGALWMVPLFAAPLDRPPVGSVRLTALDIGQGTSVMIETHDTNVLYDTGPQYAPPDEAGDANDAGSRVIVPFLRARGIGRLDRMIVSHNDLDHSGGALSVLHAMPVDETLTVARARRADRPRVGVARALPARPDVDQRRRALRPDRPVTRRLPPARRQGRREAEREELRAARRRRAATRCC